MITTSRNLIVVAVLALLTGVTFAQPGLEGKGGIGGAFVPAGTLYDNDVFIGFMLPGSQNSSGGETLSRTADDFTIEGRGCESGLFDISQVRVHVVQNGETPQDFGVEFYADDGTGTSPAPVDAITPINSLNETSRTALGSVGGGLIRFEVAFNATGLQLPGDTVFWISAYGTDGSQNGGSFNNFFGNSIGAPGTTPNGVFILPDASIATWTTFLDPNDEGVAYSFAIDGACAIPQGSAIPTLGEWGLLALVLLLAGAATLLLRRA